MNRCNLPTRRPAHFEESSSKVMVHKYKLFRLFSRDDCSITCQLTSFASEDCCVEIFNLVFACNRSIKGHVNHVWKRRNLHIRFTRPGRYDPRGKSQHIDALIDQIILWIVAVCHGRRRELDANRNPHLLPILIYDA